jgi:steroid delta-isomerase-like uncharacterized protein
MPDAKSMLENWFDAIEGRDVGRVMELLADDVSVETELLRQPIKGKRGLQDFLARGVNAYESIRIERRKIMGSGRDAAALVNLRVKFGADLDLMGEKLSTAGKMLDVIAAVFIEVNEAGKIARVMRVRDTYGIMQQLGLPPDRVKELLQKIESGMKERRSRAA